MLKSFAIYLTIFAMLSICIPFAMVQLAESLPPTQAEIANNQSR